jgi:hypothetical protein
VQVAKQVLWANGTSYLLHEIFGIDRNPEIDPATTDESGNKVVEQPLLFGLTMDVSSKSGAELLLPRGTMFSNACCEIIHFPRYLLFLGKGFPRFVHRLSSRETFFETNGHRAD